MKSFYLFAFTILFFALIIGGSAASLKNLSAKLSTSFEGNDNTKEKVPNENDEDVNNFRESVGDDITSELDKLKAHAGHNKEAVDFNEQLEESLRKLHNAKHKADDGADQVQTHKSLSGVQQKEILENLPLPDAGEVTTASNSYRKSGHSLKNEQFPLDPASMLRHLNGKYSAYDMSQYIFWTGDEEGVASAVEELLDEGLMSRENAIEFLNDIRLGINYLENMYSMKQNGGKNIRPKATTTTTQESSMTDELPFSYSYNYQKFHSFFKPTNKDKVNIEEDETPTLSPVAIKALEKIPSLIKLTEAHRESGSKQLPQQLPFESDESTGRTRLADYLFGEYSLEEVIYQLAKTMFTQSLTHGSEESQVALQKLTQFLENEGKHGRISPALQKKILDVLLAALSDTLSENPEVMEKARHALTTK